MTEQEQLELGQFQDCEAFGLEYSLIELSQYVAEIAKDHGLDEGKFGNLMVLWSYDKRGENLSPREIWGTRYGVAWLWAEFELLWMEEAQCPSQTES